MCEWTWKTGPWWSLMVDRATSNLGMFKNGSNSHFSADSTMKTSKPRAWRDMRRPSPSW